MCLPCSGLNKDSGKISAPAKKDADDLNDSLAQKAKFMTVAIKFAIGVTYVVFYGF